MTWDVPMKKGLLLTVVLGVIACLILIGVGWFGVHKSATTPTVAVVASSAIKPTPQATPPPALMGASEWQKYRSARESVLQSTPSLQSEYKDILKAMDGQQAKLDAAMLKADPQLAPVISKLQALRTQNSVSHSPSSGQTNRVANLTPEDMQELRTARTNAMQSDTNLMADGKNIADKMRKFEDALDAAMVKSDPSLAPIIAKFEAGRHSPRLASISAQPK